MIEKLDLFSEMNFVDSVEGRLLGAKGSEAGNDGETRYYYFQDMKRKIKEDSGYMRKAEKKKNFNNAEYEKRKKEVCHCNFCIEYELKI